MIRLVEGSNTAMETRYRWVMRTASYFASIRLYRACPVLETQATVSSCLEMPYAGVCRSSVHGSAAMSCAVVRSDSDILHCCHSQADSDILRRPYLEAGCSRTGTDLRPAEAYCDHLGMEVVGSVGAKMAVCRKPDMSVVAQKLPDLAVVPVRLQETC